MVVISNSARSIFKKKGHVTIRINSDQFGSIRINRSPRKFAPFRELNEILLYKSLQISCVLATATSFIDIVFKYWNQWYMHTKVQIFADFLCSSHCNDNLFLSTLCLSIGINGTCTRRYKSLRISFVLATEMMTYHNKDLNPRLVAEELSCVHIMIYSLPLHIICVGQKWSGRKSSQTALETRINAVPGFSRTIDFE